MIETSWLKAFAAFAADANLSRAAKRLHLSQPAVHAQLRKLSEALGVPLYTRVGRGLELTREGERVAAFARDAEERMGDFVATLRGQAGERRLVLAAGAGAIVYVVADGLRAFAKETKVRLDVLTCDKSAALEAVGRGLAHVGVAALDAPPSDLEAELVTEVRQVVVVPRDHRFARRRRIGLDDLRGERLIVPPEGRPQRSVLDAALHLRGIAAPIGATARGWDVTLKLAELRIGAAIVNECCRIPRGLVARPLPELPGVRYFAFTRPRPSAQASLLVRALVAHGDAWR
jgi:DNA-binding transcriptional LysR family regulator